MAKNNSTNHRKRLLAKRAVRKKAFADRVHQETSPGSGEIVDENGQKWIMEGRACAMLDVPRELLMIWSGRDVYIPALPQDRRVRRMAILNHYCKRADIGYAVMQGDGEVCFRKELCDDLRRLSDEKVLRKANRDPEKYACLYERMQTISAFSFLAQPDFLDSENPIIDALASDYLAGRPTDREIADEVARYEEGDCRIAIIDDE